MKLNYTWFEYLKNNYPNVAREHSLPRIVVCWLRFTSVVLKQFENPSRARSRWSTCSKSPSFETSRLCSFVSWAASAARNDSIENPGYREPMPLNYLQQRCPRATEGLIQKMKVAHVRERDLQISKRAARGFHPKRGGSCVSFRARSWSWFPSNQSYNRTQRSQFLNPVLICPVIRLRNANLDGCFFKWAKENPILTGPSNIPSPDPKS